MRKFLIIFAAVMTTALGLSAAAHADKNGATVTRATLASFFANETAFYPATCHETQVINKNQRKETFRCTFDEAVPPKLVCGTSADCSWSSDFDGAVATSTHIVITASGRMVGWATY